MLNEIKRLQNDPERTFNQEVVRSIRTGLTKQMAACTVLNNPILHKTLRLEPADCGLFDQKGPQQF